jgi:GNAT superfamily N-acetyltransferase
VNTFEIGPLAERDRPALCRMLTGSEDFPQNLVYLYRRSGGSGHYRTFAAWRDGEIVGVLSGSFSSDFVESGAFNSFELPPAPHAFLDRVHVHESARDVGTGRALIHHYAARAAAHGCTFIGGSLDLSSDPTGRRAFFERLGFSVRNLDNFGAPISQIA